jgi:integrase/recombinase XerD
MNKHNIKVLFLLVHNRRNKEDKCVLKCRVTYNLKRKEFSTRQFINPSN